MNLADSLVLAVVDKLLIGVVVLVVGFWLNHRLETLKGSLAFNTALAPLRTAAYGTLWEKTRELTPRDGSVDVKRAAALVKELRDWYYDKGNAMYLSLNAADLLLGTFRLLESDQVTPIRIKESFTTLRTQLKVDLGIYSKADAKVLIPRAS